MNKDNLISEEVKRIFSAIFYFAFILADISFYACMTAGAAETENSMKYKKILNKKLPGEQFSGIENFIVRAFDYNNTGKKNGIVVAGKKLYVFNNRGKLINKPSSFPMDVQGIKIARLTKGGYYDTIIVEHFFCAPTFILYNCLGMQFSVIDNHTHQHTITSLLKDVNGDGIDEFIEDGRALYTRDGGITWDTLWENPELDYRWVTAGNRSTATIQWLGYSLQYKKGFCCRRADELFAVAGDGKIIYRKKLPMSVETYDFNKQYLPFTSGDFTGSGTEDSVAAIASDGIHVLDKAGTEICMPINIGGQGVSFSARSIKAGKLINAKGPDAIVVGTNGHVAAYNTDAEKLWGYDIPDKAPVDNLFIDSLHKDYSPKVIAGIGNKIIVLSNKGKVIGELPLPAPFVKFEQGDRDHPNMDIADINNDGYKEILAVTSDGTLTVFGRAG